MMGSRDDMRLGVGSLVRIWGKIDFHAKAERVGCSESILSYVQTGIVAGDEQISDAH